jgi:hypothetical protein
MHSQNTVLVPEHGSCAGHGMGACVRMYLRRVQGLEL